MINPKDYGAIGNGGSHPLSSVYSTLAAAQVDYPFALALTDELDWCGLQKAINLARYEWQSNWKLGLRLNIPPGRYRINRTLQVNNIRSMQIGGYDGLPEIRWFGDPESPMFRITLSDHTQFENLWLMHGMSTTNSVLSAFDMERGLAGPNGAWTPTAVTFTEVRVGGFNLGTFKYGARILLGEGGDGNNDYQRFYRCHFDSYTEAALLIAATQAHHVVMEDCGMGGSRVGKYGIQGQGVTTRLMVHRCGGGSHTVADFMTPPFNTHIDNWNSEHSDRLCQWGVGPTGSPCQLRIENCRWESDYVADDGIVRGWGPGPLIFVNNQIACWKPNVTPKIFWQSNWAGATRASLIYHCNRFTRVGEFNTHPLDLHGVDSDVFGNTYWSPNQQKYISLP